MVNNSKPFTRLPDLPSFGLFSKTSVMQWTEACGYLGSLLSSITFLPQVIKTWQTKSAGDLSLLMLFIVFISTVVWLVYAFALNLLPVIICNGIVCVLSVFLLYFKLTYKR